MMNMEHIKFHENEQIGLYDSVYSKFLMKVLCGWRWWSAAEEDILYF